MVPTIFPLNSMMVFTLSLLSLAPLMLECTNSSISLRLTTDRSESLLISSATTANPRPWSPARAASMEALSARSCILSNRSESISMIEARLPALAIRSSALALICLIALSPSLATERIDENALETSDDALFRLSITADSSLIEPNRFSSESNCTCALELIEPMLAVTSSVDAVICSVVAA